MKTLLAINPKPFNQALLGLVMCSVAVIANAADNSTPSNHSFTIRIVEKAPVAGQVPSVPKAMPSAAATQSASHSSRQARAARTVRLAEGGVIWTTSDPLALTPRLAVTANQAVKLLANRRFEAPIVFTLDSNYGAFIDHWELAIYQSSDDRTPLKRLTGSRFSNGQQVTWQGDIAAGQSLTVGDQLKYVLTVNSKAGQRDVTHAQVMTIQGPQSVPAAPAARSADLNHLARQTIPLYGSRVRIQGSDLMDGSAISIDGEAATLNNNRFVVERILPEGQHTFDVKITPHNQASVHKTVKADVKGRYLFMVGLADVTVGEGRVSGNLESLSDGDKYLDGDLFVDGRLAFYLKGKIKGKYLITAQMDTGTAEIDELFDDLHKKDPDSVFRRLDPEQYYPVYGDDSSIRDDTNSQGKMYVRVDWDKSRGLWGNFNTAMSGTELSAFNRSLYGAQFQHKSLAVTESGDHKTALTVFGSEAQSASRQNQFLGTGGSLYYLKDTDIVVGSEKIWVEVRDADSDRILETIVMDEGIDYEIDDFQGRIILTRPLLQIAQERYPSLVKDNPLDGDQVYLMVDYEYVPDDFDSNQASYGARGKVWLGDHVAIGGSYAHENRNDEDYDLQGVDITLKQSEGTYLRAEYAETKASQTAGSFTSLDGGLHFADLTPTNTGTASDQQGTAYSVDARVDLADYSRKKGAVAVWYQHREAGFSSSSIDQAIETDNKGLEARIEATSRVTLSTRVTQLDKQDTRKTTTATVGADVKLGQTITVGAEVKQIREEDQRNTTAREVDNEGTLAAIKVGYQASEHAKLYVIAQHTLDEEGTYTANDLITLGAQTRITDRLAMNAELSSGDRGDGAVLGVNYQRNDRQSFYTNYTHASDETYDQRNIFTLGQRSQVTNRLRVFNEHQFTHESEQSGLGNTFGVDYDLNERVTLSSSVQTARLEKDSGVITDRDAFSVGLSYKAGNSSASTRIEYRLDQSDALTDAQETEQWVSTNHLTYRMTPALRLQGKLNHSVTRDKQRDDKDATFTEAGIGFAYRPTDHDRLNVLGRVNFLYDLQPDSQSLDPDEKSLIASLEGTYQLNQRWQVGGKLAHKTSEIRTDRDSGVWFDNDASLASARATYHLTQQWDAQVAYHWMDSDASEDHQHGAMVSLDRHIGNNMKIGVGYNFTEFNDDLSDTSGEAEGWFINLVGKY